MHIYVHIFNVIHNRDKAHAYKLIKKTYDSFINEAELCIVLMGGDGGLMRAMEDLKPLVDIAKLTFVPLPFGSGNDMAQTLKWGASPHQIHLDNMVEICFQICCNSNKIPVNIWDVTFELKKDGDILRVGADHKPHSVLDKKAKQTNE